MPLWLFILPSRIGDAVLVTGIIDWVRETQQDVQIVLACSSLIKPLFSDLPELTETILFDEKKYDLHWLGLWQAIRKRRWQGIVDFKGSLVSLLVRSKKRYIRTSLKKSLGSMHRVEEVAYMIDRNPDRYVYSPVLWISPRREELAAGIIGKKPTLAVAPTANWMGKQWPVECYIRVIRDFLETNGDAQAAIFAAPHEKEQLGLLFEKLKNYAVLDLIQPDLDLLTVTACIKRCKLFLGNDSGLMHISAAVNTPTIGLFGPSDDCVYGPWSPLEPSPHAVIRGNGIENLTDLESRPGFSYEKKDVCYMSEIKSDKVLDVVLRKWKGDKLFKRKRYPVPGEKKVETLGSPDFLENNSLPEHNI